MLENNKNTVVEIFYHLSQIVKGNSSSQELLGFVVKAALNLLGTDRGGIVIERGGVLKIESYQGLPQDFVQSVAIPLGEGIVGRVVKEQRVYSISNLKEDPRNRYTEFEEREGLISLLAVPLYSTEKSYGAIFVYSTKEDYFDEEDEQLLKALANYMVSLFLQSDLYQDMERRLAELSTLHRASRVINSSLELEEVMELSLDTLMGIIGIRECALVLFEENGEIRDMVLGMSLTQEERERVLGDLTHRDFKEIIGKALALNPHTGEMLNLERPGIDVKDLRGHLFLPLKSRDKIIGSLAILNFKEVPLLEFTNLNFLQAFVNHVSVAFQNARFYRRVSKLAQRDAMVNLYNHSFFQKALDELLDLTEEREWPLSLLLIDIDHFKQVNDTYGHMTGDQVLKLLASILKKNTRGDDLVARYGGEEFVLILPGTGKETTLKIAERLRNQVENYIFRHDDDYIRITISIGVALYQRGMTKKELIGRADKALYVSKEGGRNKVTLFKEET